MNETVQIDRWLAEPLDPKVARSIEQLSRAPDVTRVAIMPDIHLAAGVCNGVVVATNHLAYPAAVGGDIGCGFAAVAFDGAASPLVRRQAAEAVLSELPRVVPIMRHRRRNGLPELTGELDASYLSHDELVAKALGIGREELGTLGRGNHFLEFQEDGEGRLWVMVHSGSRAMGQHITAYHLKHAQSAGSGLAWLDVATEKGLAYLGDVCWARLYAAESRRRMLNAACAVVADILGFEADASTWLNTDHNHVQAEDHDGVRLLVHRKGANGAAEGVPNVIPGSMATHTYHVEGLGAARSLMSSSHGAGRRLSRGAARAKIRRSELTRQLADVWVNPQTIPKLVDEAPAAYKNVDAVMRAQKDLVRIVRKLRPVLCYKGV